MTPPQDLAPVDVAVIGAGMAGLSTAVYARLSGLSVRVFEKHSLPGGLCTSWKRGGFTFDYCIDYFVGSGKDQGFYEIWKDLGIIDRTEFRRIESFGRYEGSDGQILDLFTDHRRLREQLLAIAPEDARSIIPFCNAIRKAGRFLMSEFSLARGGFDRFIRSLSALPTISKWSRISVSQWCRGLRNPFLREAIPPLIGSVDFPMSGPIIMFGMMGADNAGYPLGGSLPLALAAEARAKDLGAEFAYGAGVRRVLVEEGTAVGIELDDGRVQRARHVVAAVDVRSVFDRLLEGKLKDPAYEELFARRIIFPGIVQVSLGVEIDPRWNLQSLPKKVNYPTMGPILIDGKERRRIEIYQYANDPKMASPGGTVLVMRFDADYDRWKILSQDRPAYKTEKARILQQTIQTLELYFPGIGERVKASDVATPASCERYTGNWRGSTQGWILTNELMKRTVAGKQLPKAFPALKRFHMIGQWTEPGGGLPPVARNGRDVVRAIMKAEGKRAAR